MVLGAEIVVNLGGVGGDKGSELDDPGGGHGIFAILHARVPSSFIAQYLIDASCVVD